jgi:DNA-directed RNA polymerase I, II, and III subunit RPABC5
MVLGNKYRYYLREVRANKIDKDDDDDDIIYLSKDNVTKTIEGKTLDKLKLNKICCRRHILTHVDIE